QITLANSLFDINGQNFKDRSGFYVSTLIFDETGQSAASEIVEDIEGVLDMQLYYFDEPTDPFLAIGFRVANSDGSVSWILRDFTSQFEGNNIKFDFADSITVYGNQTFDAEAANIDKYLNILAEEDKTFVLQTNSSTWELYNPCSGWRFVFNELQ